jgi:hypothetical protein
MFRVRFPVVIVENSFLKPAVQIPRRHRPDLQSVRCEFSHSAVQLRRDPERKLGFGGFGQLWRAFERCIQPSKQVAIDEQLMPEQSRKVRQRPPERGQQLQVAQDEHGDERRPDLRLDRVGVRSEEGFDLQILLYRLKKQLDLPPVFVDRSNRRGSLLSKIGLESLI